MKNFTRIKIDQTRPIEFLFNSDLETELHPGENPELGVHADAVLAEMLKEVRRECDYSGQSALDFILSNGDTDARFENDYQPAWEQLEQLCPCYHVLGNHEGAYFNRDGEQWRKYFGYADTYYAWEYAAPGASVTFIVLDTWCTREANGRLQINEGSGNQAFRDEQKQWLKQLLDQAPGLTIVFAHAHLWPPNCRNQDNENIDQLIDILKSTYEAGVIHKPANVFFNGGHHDHPGCIKVDGVTFVDPIGAIHKGCARVIIDPINMRMDYLGRFNEKTYRELDISVQGSGGAEEQGC